MEKEQVKRKERMSVQISLRTTPARAKFMKDEVLSPNSIFNLAIEELMKEK